MERGIKRVGFGLAVVLGVFFPWYYLVAFVREHPNPGAGTFWAECFATNAAGSVTTDLLVLMGAFYLWSWFDSKEIGISRGVWAIWFGVSLAISWGMGVPAYFLLRESKRE